MMDIRVELSPPRNCEEHKRSWKLSADGEDVFYVPQAVTSLEYDRDALVTAITVPDYVAVDRGLVEATDQTSFPEPASDEMTRTDWYLLGLSMALIAGGVPLKDVPWEAGKILNKLNEGIY